MFCKKRGRLVLQFHITGRCNLRCKHCYRVEGDAQALSYEDVIRVIDEFSALCRIYNQRHGIKKRGHINLTGGEPFMRKDLPQILRYLGERSNSLTYSVLSNGSFLTEEMICLLKETKISFLQLSIDGTRKTHDALRAAGDYRRVLRTAAQLERAGIPTHISFTANRNNFRQLTKVAAACRRHGITRLWSDRLVPIGNAKDMEALTITKQWLPAYLRTLKKAQGNFFTRMFYPKTQVSANRALQFLEGNGSIYTCAAGESLITVDEFGRIMPCRRMPIVCGDVFANTLEEVYYHHPVFQDLQKPFIPPECAGCQYGALCAGGARCQSYAVLGDYHRADPACSLPLKE